MHPSHDQVLAALRLASADILLPNFRRLSGGQIWE
jgi:hypothetical protein